MRLDRLESEMIRALSEAIRELKDPRISMMTSVISVGVSKDLMYSEVMVSIMDTDDAKKQTIEILNKASGAIAKSVNSKMKIRRVPKFKFSLDNSLDHSFKMNEIFNRIKQKNDDTSE